MSSRHYCDICRKRMCNKESLRVKRMLGRVRVEIMHFLDETANKGDVCHACILQAVTKGKPAPKKWEP